MRHMQRTSFEVNKAPKSRPPRNDNGRQKENGTFEETKEPGILYSMSLHKPPKQETMRELHSKKRVCYFHYHFINVTNKYRLHFVI